MPISPIDFSRSSLNVPDYSGVRDILPNILKGHEIALAPAKMAEEQRKLELANALAEIQNRYEEPALQGKIQHQNLVNQYYPQLTEAQIEHYLAQAQHQREGAGVGSMTGAMGNAVRLDKLRKQLGDNDPLVQQLQKMQDLEQLRQQGIYDVQQANLKWKPWDKTPSEQQTRIAGQWTALGFNPQVGQELWNNKVTPELVQAYKNQYPGASNMQIVQQIMNDMQQQQQQQQQNQVMPNISQPPVATPEQNVPQQAPGNAPPPNMTPEVIAQQEQQQAVQPPVQQPIQPVDTRTVPIQPAMTTQDIHDWNALQANRAESKYLGNWVTEANAPYTQFPTAKDAWVSLTKRNDPKAMEERWKFMAAQMMGPETSLLNAKLAQGSSAAMAIKDIEDRLKLNIKTAGITMTPNDYLQATRIMHDVLDHAAKIRGDALQGLIDPNAMQGAIQNAQPNQQNKPGGLFPDLNLEDEGGL
jgi:hypothetical protein